MTTQRLNNDTATIDKREMTDKTLSDNRNRNDEVTLSRRYKKDKGSMASRTLTNSRNKNDAITAVRRFKADETTFENRGRNDVLTANRREINDGN